MKTLNMIKVIIIEDNHELRERLRKLMADSKVLDCILAVDSIERFMKYSTDQLESPDIILTDIGLPGVSGIEGIPYFRKTYPEAEVIMLTVHKDPDKIFKAICAGATGYLLKDTSFEDLEKQLNQISEKGGSALSPQVARRVLDYFQPSKLKKESVEKANLSEKEQQIVVFLVDGLSYQKIAEHQGISIDGIRYHIKNIYKKLHVKSKAEVIKKYMGKDRDSWF
ncbi:MAG: DNA-binding NarL/FixJ family response regulator [Polaribacter sp.]|jgi:DNA-binding NarL/FixJ family response regulator